MADEKAALPKIRAYKMLDPDQRARVDTILASYCTSEEAKAALQASFEEFGEDVVMILTAIGASLKQGLVREGLWGEMVKVVQVDATPDNVEEEPKKRTTRIRAPRASKVPKVPTNYDKSRGNLPFTIAPEAQETAEAFMTRWLQNRRTYPRDMIDLRTGEINWLAPVIYNHPINTCEWFMYLALVTEPRTYDELVGMMVNENGQPFPKEGNDDKCIDYCLKCFMVEPSWLPPGAGLYREDPQTGKMWIEREPSLALQATLPFVEREAAQ